MSGEAAAAFDFRPRLSGPRLLLRPITAADREALFEAASDPLIWQQHPDSDRYQRPVFDGFFDSAIDSGSAFVVIDRERDAIVGSSRYHGLDRVHSEIEIGWTFLVRSHWGGESNLEMKTLMLEHAFRYIKTVIFWIGEDNRRSRRATEKIGATLREGVRFRPPGSDSPNVVYELRRADWRGRLRR